MFTAILTALLLLPSTAADRKVAMVLAVKGTVTLHTEDASRPAKVMDLLAEKDRLSTATGSEAILVFVGDNHRERLKANTRVTVEAAGCTPGEAVERSEAVSMRVAYRDVPRLSGSSAGAAVVLRDPGMPNPPPAVTPVFGATVLTDRPTLSWQPAPEATAYRVRLMCGRLDAPGARTKPLWTARAKEARLPYPAKEKALCFGQTYSWDVSILSAEQGEQVIWESQFAVATRTEVSEVSKVRPLAAGENAADLLLAALTYQGYGVCDEALATFERLVKLQPKEARFQTALAYFYDRGGRLEESKRALERAKKLAPPESRNR